MKKIFLGLVAVTVLMGGVSSCKKKEADTSTPTPTPEKPKSYWKLGAVNYNSVVGSKLNDANGLVMLRGADSNTFFPNNACSFFFSTYPTQNGTYKIVDDSEIPESDELFILIEKKSKWFFSKNGGTATATVTVENKKITINIPTIKVYTSGESEVEDFTCNVIQTQ